LGAPSEVTNYIISLAINPLVPTTLYAGTFGDGVFESTDGGAHWATINTGLTDLDVATVAIDPLAPSTLYAGTRGGVFTSTDAGAHWTAINTGLTDLKVTTLAIDPATPTTLYVGTSDGGVFASTDAGAHWTAVNTGLTDLAVYALAIDPVVPATLYVGVGSDVLTSTDGGAHWVLIDMGLPPSRAVDFENTLTINPAGTAVYMGTFDGLFDFEMVPNTTTTTLPCTTARCTLGAALTSPTCVGQRIPGGVVGKFGKAESLIDQAAASPANKARKIRQRARHLLKKAEATAIHAAKGKGKKVKLSAACAATLKGAVESVTAGL
jgi:hypothetical protein